MEIEFNSNSQPGKGPLLTVRGSKRTTRLHLRMSRPSSATLVATRTLMACLENSEMILFCVLYFIDASLLMISRSPWPALSGETLKKKKKKKKNRQMPFCKLLLYSPVYVKHGPPNRPTSQSRAHWVPHVRITLQFDARTNAHKSICFRLPAYVRRAPNMETNIPVKKLD